jgi:hypothetical protein
VLQGKLDFWAKKAKMLISKAIWVYWDGLKGLEGFDLGASTLEWWLALGNLGLVLVLELILGVFLIDWGRGFGVGIVMVGRNVDFGNIQVG